MNYGVVLRLFLLFLSLISIQAFAKTPTVEELVDKADRLYRNKTAHLMLDEKLETLTGTEHLKSKCGLREWKKHLYSSTSREKTKA